MSDLQEIAEAEKAGEFDARWKHWQKPIVWSAGILALLGLYFLGYPALIVAMEERGMIGGPETWSYRILEPLTKPLIWLIENVELYERDLLEMA